MRPTLRSTIFAPLLVAACGAEAPPVTLSPAAAATPAAPAAPPPPAPIVDASPTVRTPEQKARDDARAPLANTILSAFENDFPKFSPDRKKVVFGSNRGGNRQYYLADIAGPSTPPVAITHGAERGSAARFMQDGKSIRFLRDAGVDENYRIFLVGLDGKNEICLTPGPVKRRFPPLEPRDKPGTLVYWQLEPKSPATEIVVQRVGGEPKVVYTDPSPSSIGSVTSDGRRALMLRRYSSSDYVLFELDLATAKLRRLYPDEGKKAAIHAATYSADGKRAYVAADDGADGQLLYAFDVASGAIVTEYRQSDPRTASVQNVIASPRGDRLAIVIDAGDHEEARILDAKTLRVTAKVKIPPAAIALTAFSEDGVKIGASISTPDAPSDIFSIDAATGDVEPLRREPRPGLEDLGAMETSLEALRSFDGLSIPLVVQLPPGARAGGKRLPVIVQFHGGPAGSATVDWDAFARFFTALGYAFVQPNVRGSTGYGRAFEMADNREKRADWLKDVESVNAWAKAQPWADRDRVVAMGGSYGGYSVLMALTRQPSLWRAGVDYVGIANLLTFMRSTTGWLRAVWVDEFGDLEKDRALLEEWSPLREVGRIVAPLFVYAGQNDPRVPREESDQVVVALRRRGVPVEYQIASNEGHSLDHRENRAEFMTRVARFLEDSLR